MRCPACQARNPETADWCSQCYASLRPPEPPPPPPASAPPASPERAPEPATVPSPAGGEATPDGRERAVSDPDAVGYVSRDGRFRRTEEGLDWRCPVCDEWSPIERTTCVTCGAPFAADTDRGPEPGERMTETGALLASAALPGLGHILMGRAGGGTARAILYVTWLIGGLLLVGAAARAAQPILPAIPLLLGALIVWSATLLDAVNLHRGRPQELLKPRTLLWLTVGVMGATMFSFAGAAFTVTAGS